MNNAPYPIGYVTGLERQLRDALDRVETLRIALRKQRVATAHVEQAERDVADYIEATGHALIVCSELGRLQWHVIDQNLTRHETATTLAGLAAQFAPTLRSIRAPVGRDGGFTDYMDRGGIK